MLKLGQQISVREYTQHAKGRLETEREVGLD